MAFCIKVKGENGTIKIFPNDTLLVTCVSVAYPNDSSIVQSSCISNSTLGDESLSYSDSVSTLTLIINAINNLYTRENLFVAMVALAIALIGFFGFRSFKSAREDLDNTANRQNEQIKDCKNIVDNTTKKINEETLKLKRKNEEIEKVQLLNNQYMKSINEWMFLTARSVAEAAGCDTDTGQNLLAQSHVNYYLMKLFLTNDQQEIDACINYIKTQADEEVIEHLQFIVDNDINEYKKQKAAEAIGYIHGRITSA